MPPICRQQPCAAMLQQCWKLYAASIQLCCKCFVSRLLTAHQKQPSLPWQVWKTLVQEEGARSLFKGAMYPVTTIAMQVWLGHTLL